MPKYIDKRDFSFNRITTNFAAEATSVSDDLPGNHRVNVERVNPFTGSAEQLRSVNAGSAFAAMPGFGPTAQSLIEMAQEHLRVTAPAIGFGPGERVEFVPDPNVKETSTGERVVNLQQQYHGIPVFQMERAVLFGQGGAVQTVTGTSVGLPEGLETLPLVALEAAASAAARHTAEPDKRIDAWSQEEYVLPGVDISTYEPKVLGRVALPSQPAVLEAGPFGESIPAHLVLFYLGETTRLAWHFIISMPNLESQYVILVEADSQTADRENPEVLYAQQSSSEIVARGKVWTHNPGTNGERQLVEFPRPLTEYPIDPLPGNLPETFPFPWVDGVNLTIGNNAVAVIGNTLDSLSGRLDGETLIFDPDEPEGNEQKVLNIFYFCNFMHDFFYMLGFDEPSGNFQKINFSMRGHAGDPVLARAHAGAVTGTANMMTRADGQQGLMNMGLMTRSNRHTAFDSDVVFHEYTHGVTNRLVGGRLDARALQQPQSRGMGEGWSDYFAITIQNYFLDEERVTTGSWVAGDERGIRSAPYTDDYPGSFGQLGRPPYDTDPQGRPREHNIGEIWCAALMKMNRDLSRALADKKQGHLLGWQIVVDGLKFTPANPSFLDARDAILRALEAQRGAGNLNDANFRRARRAVWGAFAHFGMGPNARSVGASLEQVIEDKSLPPGL